MNLHLHVWDLDVSEDELVDIDLEPECDYGDYVQYVFIRNGETFEIRVPKEA